MSKTRKPQRRRPWSEAELALLTRNYADSRTIDLATVLERHVQHVYAKANSLGLCKSEAYLAGPAACRLRRGDKVGAAAHVMPIGAHRVIDGTIWRKVSAVPNVAYSVNWKSVHRLVWEAAHGPVPAGHVLRFRDGMKTLDPALVTLDRLELLTHAQNMARNSVHTLLPPALAKLVQLRGALNRSINKRAKRHERSQDDQ